MTEIERLRQDIAKLEEAQKVCFERSWGTIPELQQRIKDKQVELAKLEAEATKKVDPWQLEKDLVKHYQQPLHKGTNGQKISSFAVYLQNRVIELEQQEYKDIEKIFNLERELNWRNMRIAALEDEISRSQVWVIKDNDLVIEGPFFTLGFANERAKLIRSRISDTCTVEPWKGGAL